MNHTVFPSWRSLPALGAFLALSSAFADSPDTPIVFESPVTNEVVLNNPNNFAYQVYAPLLGPLIVEETGRLTLTNGAVVRYHGTIVNDGVITLARHASNRVGSISFSSSSAMIVLGTNYDPDTLIGFTTRPRLQMLGGSIFNPFVAAVGFEAARLVNSRHHTITNDDGIPHLDPTPPAYTGLITDIQLTNHGDIESVRSGGRLTFGLGGRFGEHINSPTGRIFAHDRGTIVLNLSHGGFGPGTNYFSTFTNEGLITTSDPRIQPVGSLPTSGGTIRLSSFELTSAGWKPGVFQGNNPEIVWGGRLELNEILFRNTGKTLAASNGTVRLENLVTIEGGRLLGNTSNRRFEIGVGGVRNTFIDVEFDGTFYVRSTLRLLGQTDLSGATFLPLDGPNGSYTFALGAPLTLPERTFAGRVGFRSDTGGPFRTLTLDGALTAPVSVGFADVMLAGNGAVDSPTIRLGPNVDLTAYQATLRPRTGGQLRLENGTFAFPLPPNVSSAGATLVLDNATLNLAGQALAPTGLNTAVRLENDGVLRNGRLFAGFGPGNSPVGTFHIERGRLRDVSLSGVFTVGQSLTLQNATLIPGDYTAFTGHNYTVALAGTPVLAGETLRLHSPSGGIVQLAAEGVNAALPTDGRIAADALRIAPNLLSGWVSGVRLAAGPTGELRLFAPQVIIADLNVAGDLRLDHQPLNFFDEDTRTVVFQSFDTSGEALVVDGRFTATDTVRIELRGDFSGSGLPTALRARGFVFEGLGDLSGLRLRAFDAAPATLDLPDETTLAATDAVTRFEGDRFVVRDPNFTYDPTDPSSRAYLPARVGAPEVGVSQAGQVVANGTLVLSGLALEGYVSESVTPPGGTYLPRILPDPAQLGAIVAQKIVLAHGTLAGTRYERFEQARWEFNPDTGFLEYVGDETVRRWTLPPQLIAAGDLRLETGRYALEDNMSYGRLVIGDGATLTRRENLFGPWDSNFVGDSLDPDPDSTPLPNTVEVLDVRGVSGVAGNAIAFDGGRLEGMKLYTRTDASDSSSDAGAAVFSRATFAADARLVGTLDHATGAITRFEGGSVWGTDYDTSFISLIPLRLRSAPGLAGAERRFEIEIAPGASDPAVRVGGPPSPSGATRLEGNVTVRGVGNATAPRGRLELFPSLYANLVHDGDRLDFAGDLAVIVNGQLESTGTIAFAPGVQLFGDGRIVAPSVQLDGQTLPGNSPGGLTFLGDLSLGATHNLVLEIGFAPWNSDGLIVEGNLGAGGRLTLVFLEGVDSLGGPWFSPEAPLLRATSVSGSFATLEVVGLDDPTSFSLAHLLRVGPASLFSDIRLIPEPSTYAAWFALAALVVVALRRRARG